MERGEGRPEIRVALIDGPVAFGHPDLSGVEVREIPGRLTGTCDAADSTACAHGTFVAGILFARRGSAAPAICPGCTLLVRPIFADTSSGQIPSAPPEELASAIVDSADAGAHVINLSSALVQRSSAESQLKQALDYAAHTGVITVAAAGNQGTVGSSVITRHPWVIPVAACNAAGWPLNETNLGKSIGRNGLRAPGESITSLAVGEGTQTGDGTSAAAAFVTGAIALLWSEFRSVSAPLMRRIITEGGAPRRAAIAPPLLNAWAAYVALASAHEVRGVA
jgi:subtilisin family serine protease